jgi:predicted DNA binding CopG/RHH family protein
MTKNKQVMFRISEEEFKKFKLILTLKGLTFQGMLEKSVKSFLDTEEEVLNQKIKEVL